MSGLLFGLMLALRAWLQWIGPLPFDHFSVDHHGSRGVPSVILNLFSGTEFSLLVVATMIVGTFVAWRLAGRDAAAGFLLSALVVIWNTLLKAAFGPVPFWTHGRAGVDYPSGHMSWTTAIFGYGAWIAAERRWLCAVAAFLGVVIATAVERVLSGAHTVSDLIGGVLLATAWITITISYVYGGRDSSGSFRLARWSGVRCQLQPNEYRPE